MRASVAFVLALAWGGLSDEAFARGPRFMMRAKVQGQKLEGQALSVDAGEVQFLSRDGQLRSFPASAAKNYEAIGGDFKSYSPPEMRALLEAEFGSKFDVTGTG